MKQYFINVWLGVFTKPQNAIDYVLKNRNDLFLSILFTLYIFFYGYSSLFISSLAIAKYIHSDIIGTIFFGLLFLLFFLFGKIFGSKANKKDIFFVLILSHMAWFLLLVFNMIFIITIVAVFDIEPMFPTIIGSVITVIYYFYILIMLLNKVQNISKIKSILVLFFVFMTLAFITILSNYFLKEQQNLGISIYEMMIKNTKNISKKVDYHITIAEILEDQELYEDAITHYFVSVKLEDDNTSKSEIYYWIAEDYKKLDRYEDALIYAEKSLALTPDDEDSLEQVSELKRGKP